MKNILIKLIKVYQKIPGNFHNSCRHIPTCSNYGIEAINEYGSIKGSYLTFIRILKCTPWGTSGYDPVIKKERKNEKNN
jgi:putative membrane protein insertion efficiency factor